MLQQRRVWAQMPDIEGDDFAEMYLSPVDSSSKEEIEKAGQEHVLLRKLTALARNA